ncbi:MAG: BatA domain-containing protein [Halobacteriaceae archaeon]
MIHLRMVGALVDLAAAGLALGVAAPLGLAAAGLVVPLAALYLLKPDPSRVELPTMRFLHKELDRDDSVPAIEHLPRSLLLLLQALLFVLFAVSLASPYVPMAAQGSASGAVVVLDASASMATQTGDGTRFERAVAAARASVGGETTVIVAGHEPRVVVEDANPTTARQLLAGLSVADTGGSLGSAIAQGASLAEDGERVLVFSDFADAQGWRTPVRVAAARDQRVSLHQFSGGGADNVGIVELSFRESRAVATVRNYGSETVTRTLTLAGSSETVTLAPGDTTRRALPVPANGATLSLSPGDSFPADDAVTVAAPSTTAIRVLLLTNDVNRELVTAYRVMDTVDLTVARPPGVPGGEYDLVVFGQVDPARVDEASVEAARAATRRGGGVVVTARPGIADAGLGKLLPVTPTGTAANGSLGEVSGALTEGIAFPDPRRYLRATLDRGEALVSTEAGDPLVARAPAGDGSVLYYGYLGNDTRLERNFMYPVFWKRVAVDLSGRPTLAELNHETGARLAVSRTVGLPDGTSVEGPVTMRQAGVYAVGDTHHAAALLDADESAVAAEPLDRAALGVADPAAQRLVNVSLTPVVAGLAVLLALGELGFLAVRGYL